MTIEYMACPPERALDLGRAVARGFGNHPPPDSKEKWLSFFNAMRTIAAFDDGEVVGTSGSLLSPTTVPGGASLQTALVTIVTVSATHRRRGVLTNMMKKLLTEAKTRGESIATLWASESVIYGRFGYGMAGQHHWTEIDREKASIAHLPTAPGKVKFIGREKLREVAPDVWKRTHAVRPGMPLRHESGWQNAFPLPVDESKTDDLRFHLAYEENGRCDGYLVYKTTETGLPNGTKDIEIPEFVAATDAAHAALTAQVMSIDLVNKIRFPLMASDDPLWWMLADPRELRRRPYDAIWLRMLDVPEALSTRKYPVDGELIFEVEDEFMPECGGRFELIARSDGAVCNPTSAEAHISLPTASLAACYFGGAKFADLARAGRVEEKVPGALARADAMFAAERDPWCPLEY